MIGGKDISEIVYYRKADGEEDNYNSEEDTVQLGREIEKEYSKSAEGNIREQEHDAFCTKENKVSSSFLLVNLESFQAFPSAEKNNPQPHQKPYQKV